MAQAAYQDFVDLGSKSNLSSDVLKRLRWLARQQAEASAKRALALEDSLQISPNLEPGTLAVTHFSVIGNDPDLEPLSAALSDWIVNDLSKAESANLVLIERLRLDALLREIELGQSQWVDQTTAPRVGRLLSAERILSGSLLGLENRRMQGDLVITEAGAGASRPAGSAAEKVQSFVELEKRLVFELLESLGVTLTPFERAQIEAAPTRDMRAILAYGGGLAAERRGDWEEARAGYKKALEFDAGYAAPRLALDELVTDPGDLDALMTKGLQDLFPPNTGSLEDRLEDTGSMISGDFWPESPGDVRPTPFPLGIPRPPETETPGRPR